jgi:hypothetical protein
MLMASSSSNKESLAELWQDFLEREANEGKGDASRRGSTVSRAGNTVSPPPRTESGLGISEKK